MLFDDELRNRLPLIDSQLDEANPWVFAKFFLPETDRAWYVIEGVAEGDDCLFFGFVTGVNEFAEFRLRELEAIRAERDSAFTEGPFTDVVPAPED